MRFLLGLLFIATALVFVPRAAHAAACAEAVDFQYAGVTCTIPGGDADDLLQHGGGGTNPHQYTFEPNCHNSAQTCDETPTCTVDDKGTLGEDMIIYEDGVKIGETCWTATTADPQLPTPDQVMAAARNLSWPAATLVIQPPDGETLVNFATNFYTTTTKPQSQTVPLLDVSVTIEATPSAYTWRFGDGASHTGKDPGAAYPDLGVTHRYLRKGEMAPRVDITYAGRYRIGDGAWQTLPDTLTVAGAPQPLRVLTATPHLVGG